MSRALAPETRALTVRQSWAWAIVHAGKDVENRTWQTHYRGSLLIHAGSALDRTGSERLAEMAIEVPSARDLLRGAVIGCVEIMDCVLSAPSPWAIDGMWHWVLANPRPVDPPVTCPGRLGLWQPSLAVIRQAGGSS